MEQKPLRAAGYFLSLLILLYAIASIVRISLHLAPDFSVYYTAAYDLSQNHPIYTNTHVFTNFGYPPITAFFYIPFLLFPYAWAQTFFIVISTIAAVFSLYLSFKLTKIPLTPLSFLIGLALVFLSFPTKFTLGMGQSNFVAYAFLLGSLLCYQSKQQSWAVVFFSLAILLKPILIISILFFFFEKQWKIFLSIAATCIAVFGIMFFIYPNSIHDTQYYLQHMLPILFDIHGRGVYYNQGIVGFFIRTFGETSSTARIGGGVSLCVFLLMLLFMNKVKDKIGKVALLLTVLPLIDSLSWQHHFVMLLLPFVYVAQSVIHKKDTGRLLALGTCYFLVSGNMSTPGKFLFFPGGVFLLSHTMYGTLLLFVLEVEQILLLRKRKLLETKSKLFDRLLIIGIKNKRN